jgi:hypothetical protein
LSLIQSTHRPANALAIIALLATVSGCAPTNEAKPLVVESIEAENVSCYTFPSSKNVSMWVNVLNTGSQSLTQATLGELGLTVETEPNWVSMLALGDSEIPAGSSGQIAFGASISEGMGNTIDSVRIMQAGTIIYEQSVNIDLDSLYCPAP